MTENSQASNTRESGIGLTIVVFITLIAALAISHNSLSSDISVIEGRVNTVEDHVADLVYDNSQMAQTISRLEFRADLLSCKLNGGTPTMTEFPLGGYHSGDMSVCSGPFTNPVIECRGAVQTDPLNPCYMEP